MVICLTLREEDRLRVFDNNILMRILKPKRDENGVRRRHHNEKLHSFHHSPIVFRVIKPRRYGLTVELECGENGMINQINLQEIDPWEGLSDVGRIIFKWVLEKYREYDQLDCFRGALSSKCSIKHPRSISIRYMIYTKFPYTLKSIMAESLILDLNEITSMGARKGYLGATRASGCTLEKPTPQYNRSLIHVRAFHTWNIYSTKTSRGNLEICIEALVLS